MQAPGRLSTLQQQNDSPSHQQRRTPKRQHAVPTTHERYDYDTGQVYKETVCKAHKSALPWYRHAVGSATSTPDTNRAGTSTLKSTALRTLLRNLDCLELESLQGLDWAVGKKLLGAVERNQLKSFEVWRIFVTRYFKEKPGNYERYLSDTQYELDNVVTDLTKLSKGAPFLTFLTINDCVLPPHSYLQLGELPNLAVLKLWETGRSDTLAGFNERILRAWQAATINGASFRNLRALELTDMGLASEALLASFEHYRNLSLIRVVPSYTGTSKGAVFGSWEQPYKRIKRSKTIKELVSGKTVTHSSLLSCALEASNLPQCELPTSTISYGRNEATRYYGERPTSSEVWLRMLNNEKRPLPQQAASLPPLKKRIVRRDGKDSTLGDMLTAFRDG